MENHYSKYKELGLFNNGEYLVFSLKKTEKILSAIYLISSLIKDNEPMKWELRECGMSLLSVLMTLNGVEATDKNRLLQSFFLSSAQLISYLNISRISGLISDMNAKIIIDEIHLLVDYIKQQTLSSVHSAGFILSDTFFATDMNINLSKKVETAIDPQKNHKNKAIIIKDKKDSRKNNIISLLKKDSNLTIKDFVKVIKDCSEKTIQRELIDLVKSGVVKKEGERRWSTYSLM
jgi:hypothetical protein